MSAQSTMGVRADGPADDVLPTSVERVIGEIQALLGDFQAAPIRKARLVLASTHADARAERQAKRLSEAVRRQD